MENIVRVGNYRFLKINKYKFRFLRLTAGFCSVGDVLSDKRLSQTRETKWTSFWTLGLLSVDSARIKPMFCSFLQAAHVYLIQSSSWRELLIGFYFWRAEFFGRLRKDFGNDGFKIVV